MEIRAIRRKVATIAGIVICLVGLFMVYYLDVSVSAHVKWLLAALCLLCAGASSIAGSYFVINSETKAWIIFDILAPVFSIGYLLTLFPMVQMVTLLDKNGQPLLDKAGNVVVRETFMPSNLKITGFQSALMVILFVVTITSILISLASTLLDVYYQLTGKNEHK